MMNLLYGWLSRLSLENGYSWLTDFGKRFLTERTVLQPLEKISWYPRVDFIRDLDRTCEEYKEISFFPTADELLRKMTPLYAVFPFLTYGNQSWWTQFILREPGTALTGTGNRGNMIPEFLSCPECRKQDRKKYGFSYLRTWHHLPGVRVCAVHRVPLQTLAYRKQKVLDPDEDGIILSEKRIGRESGNRMEDQPICKGNDMNGHCFLIFADCRHCFWNVWKNRNQEENKGRDGDSRISSVPEWRMRKASAENADGTTERNG